MSSEIFLGCSNRITIGVPYFSPALAHFLIHCSMLITDSTSSCPLVVNVYSTRGGISLYLCFSNMPLFSNSLSRIDRVLVLKPFKVCLNCLCLTGLVFQVFIFLLLSFLILQFQT